MVRRNGRQDIQCILGVALRLQLDHQHGAWPAAGIARRAREEPAIDLPIAHVDRLPFLRLITLRIQTVQSEGIGYLHPGSRYVIELTEVNSQSWSHFKL